MKKEPNPVDVHVGTRLRMRRLFIGMSQEKLGAHLGLTFQQVQKYEKGLNRIGASRLYAIARILDAPVQYFFDDMPTDLPNSHPVSATANGAPSETPVAAFLATSEGVALNVAFSKIRDTETRKRLADLVRTLAEETAA
ncbi:MAG: helix-turn-helix domain-containing protein [Pikeienuella sp.]